MNDETPDGTRDIMAEGPISMATAARAVPVVDGRQVSPTTVWRWATRGVRGVRLECIRVGRRMCTSRAALFRFFHRLADVGPPVRPSARAGGSGAPPELMARDRVLAVESARAILDRARI